MDGTSEESFTLLLSRGVECEGKSKGDLLADDYSQSRQEKMVAWAKTLMKGVIHDQILDITDRKPVGSATGWA